MYRFAAIASGSYALTVTVPGFRTFKQVGIDLSVGRLPNVDVKLEVGAVAETVEVAERCFGGGHHAEQGAGDGVEGQSWINLPKGRSFQSVIPVRRRCAQRAVAGTATMPVSRSTAPATPRTST